MFMLKMNQRKRCGSHVEPLERRRLLSWAVSDVPAVDSMVQDFLAAITVVTNDSSGRGNKADKGLKHSEPKQAKNKEVEVSKIDNSGHEQGALESQLVESSGQGVPGESGGDALVIDVVPPTIVDVVLDPVTELVLNDPPPAQPPVLEPPVTVSDPLLSDPPPTGGAGTGNPANPVLDLDPFVPDISDVLDPVTPGDFGGGANPVLDPPVIDPGSLGDDLNNPADTTNPPVIDSDPLTPVVSGGDSNNSGSGSNNNSSNGTSSGNNSGQGNNNANNGNNNSGKGNSTKGNSAADDNEVVTPAAPSTPSNPGPVANNPDPVTETPAEPQTDGPPAPQSPVASNPPPDHASETEAPPPSNHQQPSEPKVVDAGPNVTTPVETPAIDATAASSAPAAEAEPPASPEMILVAAVDSTGERQEATEETENELAETEEGAKLLRVVWTFLGEDLPQAVEDADAAETAAAPQPQAVVAAEQVKSEAPLVIQLVQEVDVTPEAAAAQAANRKQVIDLTYSTAGLGSESSDAATSNRNFALAVLAGAMTVGVQWYRTSKRKFAGTARTMFDPLGAWLDDPTYRND